MDVPLKEDKPWRQLSTINSRLLSMEEEEVWEAILTQQIWFDFLLPTSFKSAITSMVVAKNSYAVFINPFIFSSKPYQICGPYVSHLFFVSSFQDPLKHRGKSKTMQIKVF